MRFDFDFNREFYSLSHCLRKFTKKNCSRFEKVSFSRELHETSLTKFSLSEIPALASKIDECVLPRKSVETTLSSV